MPVSTIMTVPEKASYDGAILQLAGISAGSGAVQAAINAAAAPTQNRSITRRCEFDLFAVASTSISDPGLVWNANATGAGAVFTLGASNATAGVIGTVTATCGSTATGGLFAIPWTTNAGLLFTHNTADAFRYEYVVRTPTVSDGTNTYTCRVGIGAFGVGAPNEGVYFEWNANSDTHILCKTATGSAVTTAVTSTVVAGTGFHRLTITKAAGTNTVRFLIDGVDVGSGTMPVSQMGPTWGVVATAGSLTTRLVEIDYFEMDYQRAANRYT